MPVFPEATQNVELGHDSPVGLHEPGGPLITCQSLPFQCSNKSLLATPIAQQAFPDRHDTLERELVGPCNLAPVVMVHRWPFHSSAKVAPLPD
ncbi:MAG TPA: hypothetical protein VGZ03_00195 [Acidimicrobiales bacterium]|nr:hypothetical protein [Acidimicrobiales bacterium]